MLKLLKYIVLGALVLFAGAIGIGTWLQHSGSFQLAVLNSSEHPAQLTLSNTTETWSIPAGEVHTISFTQQKTDLKSVTATIIQNGSPETVEGVIALGNYDPTYVLDITGKSCLVGVDFGGLFATTEETSSAPIRIITTKFNQRERWFKMPPLTARDGTDIPMHAGISAPLPTTHTFPKGKPAVYGQWVFVPCVIATNEEKLARYLIEFTREPGKS